MKFIIVKITKTRFAVAEFDLTLKSAKCNDIQQFRVFTKPLKHPIAAKVVVEVATKEPKDYSEDTINALLDN